MIFEAELDVFFGREVGKLGFDPDFEPGIRFFLARPCPELVAHFVEGVSVPFQGLF